MSKEKASNDQRWNKMSQKKRKKENEIVLGYIPKCKINIHDDSMMI